MSLMTSLLALAGCSKADILNSFIPRDGYTVHRNIAYGENSRQSVDIYVPDVKDDNHTVIMYYYGGSWQMGSKDLYRFVGQAFASKGYTTMVADYRLYPEVSFPAFVEDSASALVWAYRNISEYGGNPDRIYVVGHSAGAYNAAMITLNKRYVEAAGGNPEWIKGMIGLAGPYDFLPMTDPPVIALFSTAKNQLDTQPITFVSKGAPPILLLTGDEDDEVGPKNSRNLAAKLKEHHDSVQERVYPGVGHIGIVLALAKGFRGKAPVLEDIDRFIRDTNAYPK